MSVENDLVEGGYGEYVFLDERCGFYGEGVRALRGEFVGGGVGAGEKWKGEGAGCCLKGGWLEGWGGLCEPGKEGEGGCGG